VGAPLLLRVRHAPPLHPLPLLGGEEETPPVEEGEDP
jgi:hypothetical protein